MIRLLFVSIIIFIGAAVCSGQASGNGCPTLKVIGPAGITEVGEKMEFRAEVEPASPGLTYKWEVSSGEIADGQGTSSIRVAASDTDRAITVTVHVDGLPSKCGTLTASETASAPLRGPDAAPSDEWGDLRRNEIRARMDGFFAEMTNNPTNIGLIVLSVTNQEKRDGTNPRIKFILKHARYRKFDVTRFVFGLEKSNDRYTKLWRIPPGGEMPCDDCVFINARDVKP